MNRQLVPFARRSLRVSSYNQFQNLLSQHKNYQVFRVAKRSYQSDKKIDDAGFLDTLAGVYEDPNYKLDLKPDEWREGQAFHYVAEFGVMIVAVPCIIAAFLCFSFLAWYTFFDTQTTVLRDNPHPFFAIRHGGDTYQTRNPIMMWTYPWGPHQDVKINFYHEISDAINRKNKGQ